MLLLKKKVTERIETAALVRQRFHFVGREKETERYERTKQRQTTTNFHQMAGTI